MKSGLNDENCLSLDEFFNRWKDVTGWEDIEDSKKDVTRHDDGPLWVIAGPGTGKTEALVMRTLRLLLVDGEDPESIFLTTFTEKGAEELKDRMANMIDDFGFGDDVDVSKVRAGTLHGLCDEIMRDYRYPDYMDLELLSEDDQEFFMKKEPEIQEWIREDEENYEPFRPLSPRMSSDYGPNQWQATNMALTLVNRVRQYLVDLDDLRNADEEVNGVDPEVLSELADMVEQYQECLEENYRSDYSQLQIHFLEFLDSEYGKVFLEGDEEVDKPPLKHILVDEYQDTNPLQEKIYFKLADKCSKNLTVVGDDDQALYRFRGGSVECMVRFGEKCENRWDVSPERAQLKQNYRSHKEIVDWINRYIGEHRDLPDDARAPNKEPLEFASGITGDYPAVSGIFGGSRKDAADRMADFVNYLEENEIVDDYSRIALLLRSTKESPRNAQKFVESLRDKDIPVYNPRNKALTEQEEIKLALGCLVTLLDRELEVKNNDYIRGRFLEDVEEWATYFEEFRGSEDGEELDEYVTKSHEAMNEKDKNENLEALQDVFYRIMSCEPFSTWKEDHPNRAKRLARLSNLIEAFSSVYSGDLRMSGNIEGDVSHSWLKTFYYNFLQYIASSNFDEPEDPYDSTPEGYVQVMTVHQAKGLEFPVVLAGDINRNPSSGSTHFLEELFSEYGGLDVSESDQDDRAGNDAIRRHYVQYSRAQNVLTLVSNESAVKQIALGHDKDGDPVETGDF